jgi:hypothetical protein
MSGPAPDPSGDPRPTRKSRLSRRIYLPRIVGLGLGGLCVGSALQATPNAVPWVWVLLAFNALSNGTWPINWQTARRPRLRTANLLVDAYRRFLVVHAGHALAFRVDHRHAVDEHVTTGGRFFLPAWRPSSPGH